MAAEDGGREGAAGQMTNALLGVIGYGDIDSGIRVFMVRRLNNSMRDAGTGGAACRVKTCGSVGGREGYRNTTNGHTVGRT